MKRIWIPIAIIVFVIFCILLIPQKNFKVTWASVDYPSMKQKPLIKVYMESSGSMDGYLCEGSEFKDAIYSYVSTLASYSDSLQLNYINSQILPYKGSLQSFVRDLNVSSFRHIGGNRANSDLGDMFTQILKYQNNNSVSIFISDCILDVPQGDTKDYLVNREIDIRNAFVKKLEQNKNLGVEIFRLESKFDGFHFSHNGRTRLTNVKRPYYMWIIGDKSLLSYLNSKVPFSEIKHGYKNYYAYSTYEEVPFEITNQFDLVQKPCVIKNSINGNYVIKIRVDFSKTLQEESVICDLNRYCTQNPNKVFVSSIEKLLDTNDKNTHVLTLNIAENIRSCAETIKFVLPQTPKWLDYANDETGDSIMKNLNRTTGIKNIISGVASAYQNHLELASIKFVINN
jgi:hypothetical protein